ncbi:MAG: GGDEF domain-containing protein [Candidatus Woesearchaeota archaeon]|jgi:diguanylate cyclase (GGDEF)-like protein|nr:GGDEF domain-containing protein [Candidatus Woesearchaeota archaeon]MDP7180963.1 GGDEF domain-containing protein [Candidatus Woesearchaeota archaeon]MDP7198416.1 GGDEF domain-containing protein [Candidatus Woesearchaeota archaeon]MDP7467517.1 GGDEF domain-containing protein [Candidatus Woesearchaeota archaeon]MDP7646566.1 GGDEF domain-containing protein [Candidatus Woesearchaeota archaeon]
MRKGYELAVALLGILNKKSVIQKALDHFQHTFQASNVTIILSGDRTQLYDKKEYKVFEKEMVEKLREQKMAEGGPTPKELAGYYIAVPVVKDRSFIGAVFLYGTTPLQAYIEELTFSVEVLQKALAGMEAHTNMEEKATHDSLTKLYNRQHFSSVVSSKMKGEVSVAMLDIDNFKTYNDTKGHTAGDQLLQKVADKLRSVKGTVGRYGGEEFAIHLMMGPKEANEEMEKLRRSLESGERTVSIGLATKLDEKVTYSDLFEEADKAVYKAKAQGKNCIIQHVLIGKNLVVDTQKASELGR